MKNTIYLIFVFAALTANAQDYQYSQFYNAPLYLNPAFAGTAESHRFGLNARSQWSGVTNSLLLNGGVSFDYNFAEYNSGLGMTLNNDFWGGGSLRSTTLDFMYAYSVLLHKKQKIALRGALKAGVGQIGYNFQNLTFGDQYNNRGLIDGRATAEDLPLGGAFYTQFGGGLLLYSNKFWFGASADRFFATDIVAPSGGQFNFQRLPMQLSVHGGYRFNLNDDFSIIPAANYKMQARYTQADLGVYLEVQDFTFGTWYRGLPFGNYNIGGVLNQDAIVLQIGSTWENLTWGYSFDMTLSRLTLNTAGSHEISLRYLLGDAKRNLNALPCPNLNSRRRKR